MLLLEAAEEAEKWKLGGDYNSLFQLEISVTRMWLLWLHRPHQSSHWYGINQPHQSLRLFGVFPFIHHDPN
jgi:hypothetical protein